MIRKLFAAGLCLLALTACTSYECTMKQGRFAANVQEYTFNNGILEIKVVPGVSGIINGFEYLPEERKLFEPMKYEVKTHDLLPDAVTTSVTGGRELVWGVKNFGNAEMTVHHAHCDPEKAFIRMSTRYFQGENIEAFKEIHLQAGTLMVDVVFTIVNRDRKAKPMSLWKHLTAQITPGQRDIILIPSRGGVDRTAGRAVLPMDKDVIYHDFSMEHQTVFTAPLAPWMGRCSSDGVNRGTLVMNCDEMLLPNALFYSWKAPARPLHTAEMILPKCELKNKESKTYRIRYFFFPHLQAIRALSGVTGIDIIPGAVVLESAAPAEARSLTLFCGKEIIGTYQIPAMKPGKPYQIKIDAKYTGKSIALTGQWNNGEKFNLPEIKESVKK